ncbi:NACHT, LRR and PYD domains-containing protein 3-like [Patiria miniata]|uniref:NACHT domain-containing protein n=1 Tax=Patiria miniata TaxID=46514 RepID=A0A913Z2B6_PATMI|nr:NACHT, LRR and PYD domains-containing protein 3-like [Patiria miniata]
MGTVSGRNNPIITATGSGEVSVIYNLSSDGAGVHPQSQKPDQEPRVGDLNQKVGNKTRGILRTCYKTTGSYVQLNPGAPDDQRPIVGIYTKLQVRTKKGTLEEEYSDETVYSTEYENILKDWPETEFNRAILFGIGGVGKSTIFDKIAYDWANEACEILKRFKLLFLLKMYALFQESDLVDSIFDQLLGVKSGVAKDELDQYIQDNSNKVLILLDGFDEMRTKTLDAASFGSILKALNRTDYRKCCIFVSTRPSHLETLMSKSLVRNPCTHVEVLGFTKEDVNEYILKFYYKDPDSGSALIQNIEKSNTLLDFSTNPMLLLLMCLLWREKKQLPVTTSRLFTEAVVYMFTRKGYSSEDASKTVITIGKTALSGFVSANQNLSFQKDEFEQNALDLALKAGILTQQRVIINLECHNNIQFMHKTIQECCAGKYLQSVHMSNPGFVKRTVYKVVPFGEFQNNLRQLCQTIEGVVSNDFLLRFCCGDNEKCMTDIVRLLDRKFNKDRHKPMYQSDVIQLISQHCFFESQSKKIPQCLTSDSLIPSDIVVNNNTDVRILIYLLKIICRSEVQVLQLSRIETIRIESVSSVSGLAFALGYMENLRHLTLYWCPLVKGDLEKILSSLKCNYLLTSLDINGCNTLGGRAVEWAHIKHLTSLEKLEVRWCQLKRTDIEHIASAVHDVAKLTDLILVGIWTLGGSADLWAKELPKMKHLNKLNLVHCDLTQSDIPHIASAVGNMPRLTELELDFNDPLGGCAALWAKELPKMMHLHRLDLGNCDLTRSDIPHIASAVGNMPSLTKLSLYGNKALGRRHKLRSFFPSLRVIY